MARSERRRRRGLLRWVVGLVVLAAAGGAAAAYWTGRLADWLGDEEPPALVAPVPGYTAPPAPKLRAVARPAPGGRPSARAVQRALAPALRDPHLRDLRVVVAPLAGRPLLDLGHGRSTPASTMKLLTATAALEALGPDRTFATRVVTDGGRRIVLVGGGDPFLAGPHPKDPTAVDAHDASLQVLARLTAERLRKHSPPTTRLRLGYDASLFSGPLVNPHWPPGYLSDDVVSPITALWTDEGRMPGNGPGRFADPAAAAAQQFATYLRQAGVRVRPGISQVRARPQARELARVTSPPLADIVERVLATSDNEGAEVLAHHVGLQVTGTGSYASGVRGVRQVLSGLGIDLGDAVIEDGSGLSRHDRLEAETLVRVLQLAAAPDHPELRSVITGLPVAAYDGSLGYRFEHSAGRGLVRAKTGTLTGTSALAGLTTDARGRVLVFALVSNHVRYAETLDTRAALDRLATALATCPC